MKKAPAISDAEWEVMGVLWERSPLTAQEVVEKLEGKKAWNPRTIKTLLNRLVKKKAVDFTEQGKRYLYRPRVSHEMCVRSESGSFLERVFGNAQGAMLLQFVKQAELSEGEIEELKKALREKPGKREG